MITVAPCVWLIVFMRVQHLFSRNNGLGSGISAACSVNFYVKDGKCTTCPDGFIGHNCSILCPYPDYGRLCLGGRCTCSRELCDPTNGCPNGGSTINVAKNTRQEQKTPMNGVKRTTSDISEQKSHTSRKDEDPKMTSTTIIAVAASGSFIIIALLLVILFQRNGKINIRKDAGFSKRGSHVTSQRHVDTYCEIDDRKVAERDCKLSSEWDDYESIDRSKKDATKYTELPKRPGTSNADHCISMQKILNDDDDDDENNAEKYECQGQVRVEMRKGHNTSHPQQKRIGKTSTKISGYIDMTKTNLEDYVSMTHHE